VTPATIFFSLRFVAKELPTGPHVFPKQSQLENLHLQFLQPRDLRPEIPQRLNDLVMRMLSWEPEKRPSAAAALARLKDPDLLPAPRLTRRSAVRLAVAGGSIAVLAALILGLAGLAGALAAKGWREEKLRRLAEDEAARANDLVDEAVQFHLRAAHEMAEVANGLGGLPDGKPDSRVGRLYGKLQASYRRQMEEFAAHPELGRRFPEALAELAYYHARMLEDAGDRAGALESDRRMLEVLAAVDDPTDASVARELAAAVKIGSDRVVRREAREAVAIWSPIWEKRRKIPAERLRANPELLLFLENLGIGLSIVLSHDLKELQAAEAVAQQLADLKQQVKADTGG
jgi:hypothetical protein